MRFRFLIIYILSIIVFKIDAQSVFTRTYGAPGSFNEGKSLAITSDSGFALFGSTGGWGAINGDMVLIKTDSLGNQQWAKIYGTNNTEQGISMKISRDSGFVLAGNTNNNQNGDYDIYLVKTDSLGETIWSKNIGDFNWNLCAEVIENENGEFYILSNKNNIESNSKTISVDKLTSLGDEIWSRDYFIGNENEANSIILLNNDSLLFCGKSFNPITNSEDAFISMINSNGDSIWTNFYGDERKEWATSLVKNQSGYIGVSANRLMTEGNRRPFFFSIDANGTVQYNELQTGPQDIEVGDIQYNTIFNSYNIALELNDGTYQSAGIYHFGLPFFYVCSNVIDGLGNSNAGEIVVNYDGGFAEIGTAFFLLPGQSSIFLMRMGAFCEKSNNNLLGIEEKEEISEKIYPNPSNDKLFINDLDLKKIISINDIAGKSVLFESNNQFINTEKIENGTYFLTFLTNKNHLITIKFLVIHP
jgi:hypothetical protein